MSYKRVSVPEEYAGNRLDKALAQIFQQFSRARLKRWIDKGLILVDGRQLRPRDLLRGGEIIEIIDVKPEISEVSWQAEPVPLQIVAQDKDVIVINKQAGLVVHPAAGNWSGTLVNGLLHFDKNMAELPRVGVVHRLDKDTTGLMVVARNLPAHTSLVRQLEKRKAKREYQAIVTGALTGGGSIDAAIGRHHVHRTKMVVVANGKPAVTHYRILEKFRAHTLLRVRLETGRTHQIRVHMADKNMPLAGDKTYGGRLRIPQNPSEELLKALKDFPRQALHACKLGFIHPASGDYVEYQAKMPNDMQELIAALKRDLDAHL